MTKHRVKVRRLLWLVAGVVAASPASALDWRDLWETPAQRAERQLANGEYRQLADDAPDATWEGIARYEAGEFDAAADAFNRALADAAGGSSGVALPPARSSSTALLYNQATVATRQGRYAEALAGFDAVLDADPAHAAAKQNRAIAESLQALQDAAQDPSPDQPAEGEGEGEQDSAAEQGAGEGADGRSAGSEAGQSDASKAGSGARQSEARAGTQASGESRQPGRQPGDESNGNEVGDESAATAATGKAASAGAAQNAAEGAGEGAAPPLSEAQRAEEAAQAAAALAAEADESGTGEQAADGEMTAGSDTLTPATPRPLSEREQANEQWLRRIPDDPAGLLRRKLQQSHLNDYPEVSGSAERW